MTFSSDQLTTLPCGSIIQHGPHNNRIYLMKTGSPMPSGLPAALISQARESGYSKIFAKVPESEIKNFQDAGYQCEAVVPGLFNGEEDGMFMGFFLTEQRAALPDAAELDGLVELSRAKASDPLPAVDGFIFRKCGAADTARMAEIYRDVFPAYPFPVYEPNYLRRTMSENIVYFGAEMDGRLVALASAEMDPSSASAEMTDFATLPEWRGKRLAEYLLALMEGAMKKLGIKTVYTIARAISPGMNITFARGGYEFGGRLVNNTHISSGIESMNVWYKPLHPDSDRV